MKFAVRVLGVLQSHKVNRPVSHKVHTILCATTADGNATSERVETTKL